MPKEVNKNEEPVIADFDDQEPRGLDEEFIPGFPDYPEESFVDVDDSLFAVFSGLPGAVSSGTMVQTGEVISALGVFLQQLGLRNGNRH